MKYIIKKICCFSLILSLSFNFNAFADILDIITDDVQENINIDNDNKEKEIKETVLKEVTFSDIENHWAKSKILYATKLGFVGGYKDGTFRPDNTVTRAEFATLLNKAMKNNKMLEINFKDIKTDDWYYEQIEKSIAVGFFSGYSDNTFRPNNPISRQEAAMVIKNTITCGDVDGDGATNLKDYNDIQDWAKNSVNIVSNKSYIKGYPEGLYKPTKSLTRGEAVKIICELLDNENIEHGFNITNPDELYYGAVVVGDLNIIDSVGSGTVYINNVTVLGDIIISARNLSYVQLTDVKSKNIIVKNPNSHVVIKCNDNIYVDKVTLLGNATIEALGVNVNINSTK